MLDDLKYIHERDVQDTLGIAERQIQQLQKKYDVIGSRSKEPVQLVLFFGVGNSVIPAQIITAVFPQNVAFTIIRDFTLPKYANSQTLVILCACDLNGPGMLSVMSQAEKQGAQVAVITDTDSDSATIQANGHMVARLPKAAAARFNLFAICTVLATILVRHDIIEEQACEQIVATSDFLLSEVRAWQSVSKTTHNVAKRLALESIGRSVVITSGTELTPVAVRWKLSFNQNAKQLAWTEQYPDDGYAAIVGWTKQPTTKPYTVFEILSTFEDNTSMNGAAVRERLLSGVRPSAHLVQVAGKTYLEKMFWGCLLGDFVSIYAGLASGLNPMTTRLLKTYSSDVATSPQEA